MLRDMKDIAFDYDLPGWKIGACERLDSMRKDCMDIILLNKTLYDLFHPPQYDAKKPDDEFKNVLFVMKMHLNIVEEHTHAAAMNIGTLHEHLYDELNMARMYQFLFTGGGLNRMLSNSLLEVLPIPSCFKCPLTLMPFVDPVTLKADLHTFERKAIDEALRHRMVSPTTKTAITGDPPYYYDNLGMIAAMRAWEYFK